jgi:hypothetical protein
LNGSLDEAGVVLSLLVVDGVDFDFVEVDVDGDDIGREGSTHFPCLILFSIHHL